MLPLILHCAWPDLRIPPILPQVDPQHLLQTVRPRDRGWHPQCLTQHDMPQLECHERPPTHSLLTQAPTWPHTPTETHVLTPNQAQVRCQLALRPTLILPSS